jgi:DNA replicative helicase MCM subunit Mcm2 (Cdc46/Mcm family)
VYNKAHTDYAETEAYFAGQADSLLAIARQNPNDFQQNYINKAVEVEGVVNQVGSTRFTLGSGVICTLDSTYLKYMPAMADTVLVKGRVVGTDEDILTAEVLCTLDQCIIIDP